MPATLTRSGEHRRCGFGAHPPCAYGHGVTTRSRERPEAPPGASRTGHRATEHSGRARARPAHAAHAANAAPTARTAQAASAGRGRHATRGAAAAPDAPDGTDGSTASRAAAYDEAYLDGLFTYCLSIMCEHDAATAALGEALALAERQHERGRRPADPRLRRAWLYALARWACLRRLAENRDAARGRGRKRKRHGAEPYVPRPAGEDAQRRRQELAALAWPEAAGTTPDQREALELAVRHQLAAEEIARVLRLTPEAARSLLTAAAREVERTRGALAAVESSGCPAAASLSGEDPWLLLGPSLRRELVRHVDECPSCRLVAQHARASAGGHRPARRGSRSARLPVLAAPLPAVHAARLALRRARSQHTPRYDRAGFPLPERDRAARRERLRHRAMTGTVVVTVLAAPVMALWAAYENAPRTGEARTDGPAAAADGETTAGTGFGAGFENTGRSRDGGPAADGGGAAREDGDAAFPSGQAADGAAPGPGGGAPEDGGSGTAGTGRPRDEAEAAPGRLTAHAVATATGTRITLTASGGSDVSWTARSDVEWLLLSDVSGTLSPGETAVIEVTVDREREPAGAWQGQITVEPAAAVITVEGEGSGGGEAGDPGTTPPGDPGEPEDPGDPAGTEPPAEDPAGPAA